METTPSAAELIEAAVETIRAELLPVLSGRAAFQARVAVNVLETARRELAGAPAADTAELARLRVLLASLVSHGAVAPATAEPPAIPRASTTVTIPRGPGPGPDSDSDSDSDLPALRRALCAAIRDGRADLATPGLADHLWADVLARVAIDQPTYPSFVREAAPSDRTRP